jgi:hypothetical protein
MRLMGFVVGGFGIMIIVMKAVVPPDATRPGASATL